MVIEQPGAASHLSISEGPRPPGNLQEFDKYFAFSEMERDGRGDGGLGGLETGAEKVVTAEEQIMADPEMEDRRMRVWKLGILIPAAMSSLISSP